MLFKPMKRRDYERWIHQFGWSLQKSGFDWSLIDEQGYKVCTIRITHPGNEVVPGSVKKTEKHLKERGKRA